MATLSRTWYYNLDPELKIIHAFVDCAGLKVARKYNYHNSLAAITDSDLVYLDSLLESGWKTCHPCYKREEHLARKDNRRRRPGFGREPRK